MHFIFHCVLVDMLHQHVYSPRSDDAGVILEQCVTSGFHMHVIVINCFFCRKKVLPHFVSISG